MIERVRREETWHREAKDCYPDPFKIIRIQFPVVEELRDTPRESWPRRDALPTALGFLSETFEDAGWDDLARRLHYEELGLRRESGRPISVRRVLSSLRANLFRQELYDEAVPVAQEEYVLAKELGEHEVSCTAKYWVTVLLGKLGRHEEAARNAGESVAERRAYQPSEKDRSAPFRLAHAHLEYAHRLTTIGEYEQAADATEEAAAFWRQQPNEDGVGLYTALDELSVLQVRLGRFDEARKSALEAVDAFRRRAAGGSPDVLRNLASALTNHANRLHDLGLDQEALRASQESVERYRVIAAQAEGRAVVMKMDLRLAQVLVSLASRLHDVGRLDESCAASDEAIALAGKHADRVIGRTELARAWANKASALISRRAYAEAAGAAAKGVELYETPNGKAMARNTFAVASAHLRQYDVALEASLQSVAEYRERHAEDTHEYAYRLADALTDHALIRVLRAERAEAEAAIAESLALHEELVIRNPGRYQRELDRARAVAAQI
ncbi:hypothetical protein [Lentzea kentuckyensis]|uniref:hypothetical protein n=1 Tax=Lentzea kentuckyensis TaxID=360086 RepID=UPI000A3827A9|nr:hypothetical protein [Lentzea kentuckyensis]